MKGSKELTVKKIVDKITASIAAKQVQLDALPREAYDFWVGITPKDTGNARRNTRLVGNEIQANYAYAVPLDQGSSKQFQGRGMSKPTEKFIAQRLRAIMRK